MIPVGSQPKMCPLECRSETGIVLTTASFDSKQVNWAMLGEFVLAVLVTQMDVFQRLLGIAQLNLRQFAGHRLITRATWHVSRPQVVTQGHSS